MEIDGVLIDWIWLSKAFYLQFDPMAQILIAVFVHSLHSAYKSMRDLS